MLGTQSKPLVRVTHTPTGLTVFCDASRSANQNRGKAIKLLKARLWALKNQTVPDAEIAVYELPDGVLDPNELNEYRREVK